MPEKSKSSPQAIGYLYGRRTRIFSLLGLGIILILIIGIATSIGSVPIPLGTTAGILVDKLPFVEITPTWQDATATIVLDIRLPRIILAGLVGAALAVAGATYQGLFRNPLADPYLIGVAQGASLGAVIGFLLPAAWNLSGMGVIPVFAFIGAIAATVVVYFLSRVGKTLPVTTLILAGVALSALLGSIVSYLVISSGSKLHSIVFWMMGSFSGSAWSEVFLVLPYIAVGIAVIVIFARLLNVMQLDEEQAQQLGVNVEKFKIILLAAATLITAASVAFVGTIGFVGIIIPHAVRLIWGADHRFLLPLSILTGAIFMILTDLVSRTVLAPTEIPIGVITAICGAPFFLYLLRRRKRAIF
ncbi:MAG: iron chelate uptake ABC transporter family permease subunit [Dehalococcoidales bacterium]|nr:iron chelate uptake ABC transporter family permease subunit [Dehalococcoidales bacterium]